jgi:hypothetical protein
MKAVIPSIGVPGLRPIVVDRKSGITTEITEHTEMFSVTSVISVVVFASG